MLSSFDRACVCVCVCVCSVLKDLYSTALCVNTLSYLSVIEGPVNGLSHGERWVGVSVCLREYISLASVRPLSVLLTLTLSAVMLRPAVLGLLLACVVSLGSSAVVLENGMPILWAHTTGQVTDMPVQDGILTPDPWNYLQRMSLLRLTIAATDPLMGCMGGNATDSPLWGLALQLGWMLTSGKIKIFFYPNLSNFITYNISFSESIWEAGSLLLP